MTQLFKRARAFLIRHPRSNHTLSICRVLEELWQAHVELAELGPKNQLEALTGDLECRELGVKLIMAGPCVVLKRAT